jgi:hypothetical protein
MVITLNSPNMALFFNKRVVIACACANGILVAVPVIAISMFYYPGAPAQIYELGLLARRLLSSYVDFSCLFVAWGMVTFYASWSERRIQEAWVNVVAFSTSSLLIIMGVLLLFVWLSR